ncbi:MAG: DNA-directed RNA polymerase subunit K [Nanoarchaeota archaeon]|nr:DNA-directed RNA polymerase subunit K [Nanoarchaeota archaeon]
MEKQEKTQFSRYEISRILGARALQIAMNAPLLVKISKDELEKVHYDPLKIAEMEFDSGILPISVKRPLPAKREDKLRRVKEKISDDRVEHGEHSEESEIEKEGEIMELATPEDEMEDAGEEESAGGEE